MPQGVRREGQGDISIEQGVGSRHKEKGSRIKTWNIGIVE
jgi:hypothetical protein